MMRFLIGLCLCAVLSPVSALTLNGVAQFSKLSTPLYLAALSLPSKQNDAKQILKTKQWQRMDLYVLRDEWRPRQWQRQWLNDISISATPAQLEAIKDDLHDFAQLLPQPLIKNDHVSIEFYPSKGTLVKINGVLFLQTQDEWLFKRLLSIWIGELPPSRQFKQHMLGKDIQQKWLTFMADYQPPQQRIAQVKEWKREEQEKAKFLREKQLQLAAINASIKPVKKAKSIPKPAYASLSEEQKHTFKQNFLLKDLTWRYHKRIFDAVHPPAWIVRKLNKGEIVFRFNIDRSGTIQDLNGDNEGMPVMLVADVHRAIKREVPTMRIPEQLEGKQWPIELRFPIKQSLQAIIQPPKKPNFMISAN